MTLPRRALGALIAVSVAAPLAAPTAASARAGDSTIQQIFPLASGLCAKVAAGTEKKRLKPFAAQLTAACTALQTEFTEGTTKVVTTRTAVLPVLAADRAAVHTACPKPKVLPTACRLAHTQNDASIRSLVSQWHAAVHQYFSTLEAARKQFWTAVKALPVAKHTLADKPLAIPPR